MPQWLGAFSDRIPIANLDAHKSGLVAGRAQASQGHSIQLIDGSGAMELDHKIAQQLVGLPAWVAIKVGAQGSQQLIFQQPISQPSTSFIQQSNARLEKRWRIHQAIRQFFLGRQFLEVDTPVRVECPGMEPYLDSFAAGDRYLRTSPELHMKRILAAGIEPIFQMGPCFRASDHGNQHREEFIMLEWYRLFADLDLIAQDIQSLLQQLAPLADDREYFRQELDQQSCVALFCQYADLELTDHDDPQPLRQACTRLGIHFADDDDWDTLFFRIFMAVIEPNLGRDRPVLVTDYPASQSALSKCAPRIPGKLPICHRFELFIKGIEIANAFYELTDPIEQHRRFNEDRQKRAALGKPVYPIDSAFMAGLESGLPPAAGIALGVDRLVLALLNSDHFDQLLPFS